MNKINLILTIVAIFAFIGCEKIFLPEPINNPEHIFHFFWETFEQDYALFEERNVNWEKLYQEYRPKINSQTSEIELFEILSSLISYIDDGHVAIAAPNFGIHNSNIIFREKIDDDLFNINIIRNNYLNINHKFEDNNKYFYGLVKETNIAYLHFYEFRSEFVKLNELLIDFPNAEGYIVDLRHNNGGDVSHSFSFLGKFINEDKLFLRSKTKNGKGKEDYTEWYDWYLKKGNNLINKPLVILTDRHTVSAAERMVMAAKTIENCTIIGDTTNGTFGTKISKELANGWYFSYSIQKVIMFDGNSYEGLGLAPDIYIKNEISEINYGIDKTLEKAIEIINKK